MVSTPTQHSEPGVELDGVTILTNATEPNDIPF